MTHPTASSSPPFREVHHSRIAAFEGLVRSLTAWCQRVQVPAGTMDRVVLVLDELFTNIVMHGYRHDPSGEILVEAQMHDQSVDVTLTDQAPAFNPLLVPETDTRLPLEARPLGGLGLLFVRNTADELHYQWLEPEGANRLRFTLRWAPPGGGSR